MKILSYNINGLNAFCKPSLTCEALYKDSVSQNDGKMCNLRIDYPADVYCFQEVKMNDSDAIYNKLYQWADYRFWASTNNKKKGYAGVLTWFKNSYTRTDAFADKNYSVISIEEKVFPFNNDNTYTDGRVLVTEFNEFYLINVYVPNSGNKNELRKDWDNQFKEYIKTLNKPVIIVGDMNVCATELDYWGNYKKAINSSPGLMDFEIEGFNKLCSECGLVDAFRKFNPDTRKYSWYSTRNKNAVEKNQGWRLDYVLVSEQLIDKIVSVDVLQGYQAPDHSPIILEIK